MEPATLRRLADLARDLSSFPSPGKFVQEIVDTAAELTGAAGASLLLYDEEVRRLFYAGTTWCDDPHSLNVLEKLAIPLDSGAAGWIFRRGRPICAQKTGRDLLVHPEVERILHMPVETAAGAPVFYRQQRIGVLECLNANGGPFRQSDLDVLSTLASMAAMGLHAAHLENRVHTSVRETADLEQLKADFISIASHELRTPLGVIIGHTAVLQEIADRDMRSQLDVVARNAGQLRDIIENLTILHQLRGQTGTFDLQQVSLNQLVRHCVRACELEAREGAVELKAVVPRQDVPVQADPERLLLVLNNLVRNALRFTAGRQGGAVTVRLSEEDDDALVIVEDNGIGIPENEIEKIFDPFVQVESPERRKYGGMGIGLSTAKGLIEAFGGEIQVESREGSGSSFRFTLPLGKAHQSAHALRDS